MIFYLDCEFDGHGGKLLSMALVSSLGPSVYITVPLNIEKAKDPWVLENVIPVLDEHKCENHIRAYPRFVGSVVRDLLQCTNRPIILADSPVDFKYFVEAITTDEKGEWQSVDYPTLTMQVVNLDGRLPIVAGAVPHNAWWDAVCLKAFET